MSTERASTDLFPGEEDSGEHTRHTLVVEKWTLLKLRKCRLLVQSSIDAGMLKKYELDAKDVVR